MDAILRIQIKVAAREAQQALNQIAAGVRRVQRQMTSTATGGGSAGGSTGTQIAAARATATQIRRINQALAGDQAAAAAASDRAALRGVRLQMRMRQAEQNAGLRGVRMQVRMRRAEQRAAEQAAAAQVRAAERAERAKSAAGLRGVRMQVRMRDAERRAAEQAGRTSTASVLRGVNLQMRMRRGEADAAAREAKRVASSQEREARQSRDATFRGIRMQMNMRKAEADAAERDARRIAAARERAMRPFARINSNLAAAQGSQPWRSGMGQSSRWSPQIVAAQQRAANKAIENAEKEATLQRANEERRRRKIAVDATAAHNVLMRQRRVALENHNKQLERAEKERLAEVKAHENAVLRAQKAAAAEQRQLARQRAAALRTADGGNMDGGFWNRASTFLNGPTSAANRGLIAFGKDLQWVGRQLNFNFTIPLVAAGGAVMSWALDVERAMTRLKKVYGNDPTADYTEQLDQVAVGLRTLSDLTGYAQADVVALGAKWAAAGLTGGDLLQGVKNSLDLAILGDYQDLEEVFNDLVIVQSSFKLSSNQLRVALAELNTVENMTDASMQDLVKSMSLTGGAARAAGVSLEELAAMTAALIPTSGTAARAGNALKTILSNIVEPTQEMIDTLGKIGIDYWGAFQDMTGTQRLQAIADRWNGLTQAQKANFASIMAGRYQVNRFITLIDDMAANAGEFERVMESLTFDKVDENLARANKEIQTLLQSDPQRLQILWTQIKNMAIEAIMPLIPTIIAVIGQIRNLIKWFSDLDPAIQKIILISGLLIVSVGILSQFLGSVILLVGQLARPIVWLGGALAGLPGLIARIGAPILATVTAIGRGIFLAFTGPWGWAIAAVIALVVIFRDEIADLMGGLINWLIKGFYMLPEGIQNALRSVVNVFVSFFKFIAELFNRMNPFDNVEEATRKANEARRGGTADTMERAARTAAPVASGAVAGARTGTIATVGTAAVNAATAGIDVATTASDVIDATTTATSDLESQVTALEAKLKALKPFVKQQEAITRAAEKDYNAAARAADKFDRSIQPLRDEVERLSDAIDTANREIDRLADTPIQGMKNLSDAIFENEMAQKKLRLEILRMEEAGVAYDKIQDRIAEINGDIEMLRGRMEDLRQAGAGSDVLSVYERELDALDLQKQALRGQADVSKDLEKRLEELQRQGEILDLEKAIQFDPLTKQIEELANGMAEMPFDEIVAGIKAQKAELAVLQPAYKAASDELAAQEIILRGLNDERDRLNEVYQAEREKLDVLNESYGAIEEQIREVEAAIADLEKGFEDLGDFEIPEVPTGGLLNDALDTESLIAEWQRQIDDSFEKIDLFGPIKEQWESFKRWWDANIQPWMNRVRNAFGGLFRFNFSALDSAKPYLLNFFAGLEKTLEPVLEPIKKMFRSFWDETLPHLDSLGETFDEAVDKVKRAWEELKPQIEPALVAIGALFKVLSAIFLGPFRMLLVIIQNVLEFMARIGEDVFLGLLDVWLGIIKIVVSFFAIFGNLLRGDLGAAWESFKTMMGGVEDIVRGALSAMWAIIKGFIVQLPELIWELLGAAFGPFVEIGASIFRGLWKGMVGVWNNTIWPFLSGLGRIIWNVMSGVWDWMVLIGKKLLGGIWEGIVAIWNSANGVWDFFANLGKRLWDSMGAVGGWMFNIGADMMTSLWNGFKSIWNSFANWFNDQKSKIPLIGGWLPNIPTFDIQQTIRETNPTGVLGGTAGARHSGGLIPGRGESNWTLLGGEMVLTAQQQARLFAMANGSVNGNSTDKGGRTVIINGDLSFPNITSGDDAEKLISNLETIAG